jgi:hypothetical protein
MSTYTVKGHSLRGRSQHCIETRIPLSNLWTKLADRIVNRTFAVIGDSYLPLDQDARCAGDNVAPQIWWLCPVESERGTAGIDMGTQPDRVETDLSV